MVSTIGLACHPAGDGPAYEHDCDQCRYIGQVSATPFGRTANAADVYSAPPSASSRRSAC